MANLANIQKQHQQQIQQLQQQHQNQAAAAQSQQQNAQINPQEFEQMKKEYQAAIVERDRFQAQLEMLVQELEKSQVTSPLTLAHLRPYSLVIIYFLFVLILPLFAIKLIFLRLVPIISNYALGTPPSRLRSVY